MLTSLQVEEASISAQDTEDEERNSLNSKVSRPEFDIDADRIVFSPAFRRLKDKTQVFPFPEDDSVHSRLTHSIEVASVGRSLGRTIEVFLLSRGELTSDRIGDIPAIVSAACLAHDIGNPPFGHSGERTIQQYFIRQAASMLEDGKLSESELLDLQQFDGNAQGYRQLVRLHNQASGGMKLSAATLGALVKYPRYAVKGSFKNPSFLKKAGIFKSEWGHFNWVAEQLQLEPLKTEHGEPFFARHPLAYLVEAADDICYGMLDYEDGVRTGLVPFDQLDEEKIIEFLRANGKKISFEASAIRNKKDRIAKLRSAVIGTMIDQVIDSFIENYTSIMGGRFETSLVASIPFATAYKQIIAMTRERCYMHPSVVGAELGGARVLGELLTILAPLTEKEFEGLNASEAQLSGYLGLDPALKAATSHYARWRICLDYLSGMTDRYALKVFRQLTGAI